MKDHKNKSNTLSGNENAKDKTKFPGYPQYPDSEDIYSKAKEIKSIDPDTLLKVVDSKIKPDEMNEKDYTDLKTGKDLDIPGADLDDQMEDIGSEDEENNYYSLGGDLHEDLEENKE